MTEIILKATEHKRLLGFCTLMQLGDRIPKDINIEGIIFKIVPSEELVYISIFNENGEEIDVIRHDYYECELYHEVLKDLDIEHNMRSYYDVLEERKINGYNDEDTTEEIELEENMIEESLTDNSSTTNKDKEPLFIEVDEDDDEYETF